MFFIVEGNMAKYRKKPVVVEAEKFDHESQTN